LTATTIEILDSRRFNISATAACSAQNPIPHSKSTHTPEYVFPKPEMMTDATLAAEHSSLGAIGRASLVASEMMSANLI
jgi:hypothetical protein